MMRVQAQSTPKGEIISHADGDALRGTVPIRGMTDVEGFVSWELTFGYANDTTGSWFLIAEGNEPISNGLLAEWETASITDGTYNLRLTIYLEGGRRSHTIVNDLRIRNYTPIETLTPTPTITYTPYTETPLPSQTPSLTPVPTETPIPNTPTPLPTNPAEVSTTEFNNSLVRGAAGALALFVIAGLYASIKRRFQH